MKIIQKKILIASDKPIIDFDIHNLLKQLGYNIILFSKTVVDTIHIYKKYKPELILIDLDIQFGNSIELIEEIYYYDNFCKIIVIDNFVNKNRIIKALLKGATFYIFKPFRKKELEFIINAVSSKGLNIKDFLIDNISIRIKPNLEETIEKVKKKETDDYKQLSNDFFSFLKDLQTKIRKQQLNKESDEE